ncbi:response regulator [Enterovirga rhinocerotis]|uniref:Regulatory protein VirG n=1 Tax=Enterovirga rhinocerotis TaxID=1339210 RepID=A0A4R7BM44_9HYPH|nr:response regulator [Enterovirga rhinocerotis]TDR85335.1 DNA-binding response OmpR family regulator [Enterovirga rhinocerotis]
MKHVLLIDDDPTIRDLLSDYLSQHAFRVSAIGDSRSLAQIVATDIVDLVIVDLNLGPEDGLEIVRRLASTSDAPIIIISGDRLDEADKVIGLELGAVDYVTKPFGVRELLARVRVSLREKPALKKRRERKIYRFSDWELDIDARKLADASGGSTKLTTGEFRLLTAFLKAPQRILSREHLLTESRSHDDEVFDRSIDVLVLRLRRKLESDPSRPKIIRTERGAGYVLDTDVTVVDARRGRP